MQGLGRERIWRQEGLLLVVTEQIWMTMNQHKISAKELARRLHCRESTVKKYLDGRKEMTLRLLSDIACALGMDVDITLASRRDR